MLAPPHCLPASDAVVLADARPAALLAPASLAAVLADARPAALFALAFVPLLTISASEVEKLTGAEISFPGRLGLPWIRLVPIYRTVSGSSGCPRPARRYLGSSSASCHYAAPARTVGVLTGHRTLFYDATTVNCNALSPTKGQDVASSMGSVQTLPPPAQ